MWTDQQRAAFPTAAGEMHFRRPLAAVWPTYWSNAGYVVVASVRISVKELWRSDIEVFKSAGLYAEDVF